MLHWYRAAARRALRGNQHEAPIDVPTLVLWGAQDTALSQEMAAPSAALCSDGRLLILEDATHWVQHDAPGTVTRRLLDHLGRE
jgi:pimeloyl-ACP methyl ester carboxylesterase